MATSFNDRLCEIPTDHRLKQFRSKAKRKESEEVGNHGEIIEKFGNTLVRDNNTWPSTDEVGFAKWLAKPYTTGGLVIALLQPAKTQEYTADFQKVKNKCLTLVYLEQALESIIGPGGFENTSVFDAFPFITDPESPKNKSEESKNAYDTFLDMLEAKKPEVVLACWRVNGREDLSFSGEGLGKTGQVTHWEFHNGHIVRAVNGFHPSYAANFHPNESCFRRLFTLELCKAFCELDKAWQEDKWMQCFRERCRDRTCKLIEENNRDGEQRKTESGRVLRASRRDEAKKKQSAYKNSFDNGLQCIKEIFQHLISLEYRSQRSQDLYEFFLAKNTSEGLCDALLAVFEAMIGFKPDPFMLDSSPAELREHISSCSRNLVKDYIPNLLGRPSVLDKNLWSSHLAKSKSQGLNSIIENCTICFFEDVVDSISGSSKSWDYDPDRLYRAFKNFANTFEIYLGEQYDQVQQTGTGSDSNIVTGLTSGFCSLSIAGLPNVESAKLIISTTSSSSARCYKCGLPNHDFKSCRVSNKGPTTPPRLNSTSTWACFNCAETGHWERDCPSPKNFKCFKCGEVGHYKDECAR